MRQLLVVMCACLCYAAPAFAQPGTADRSDPAAAATPVAAQSGDEGRFKAMSDLIERVLDGGGDKNGVYAELGGLPPGSGISVGPGYRYHFADGRAVINASAAIGWSRSTFAQSSFELPRLAGDRLHIGVRVKWQDFTRIGYYGIGPDSLESDDSDYRLENTDYLAFGTVKPAAWFSIGGRVGYLDGVKIARPRRTTNPSIEDLFTPATAPGLGDQSSFLHSDLYADVDTRNHPSRTTSGGNYRVTLSSYSDRTADRYSFRRLEGEASQYIPIFIESSVLALRARVAGSDTSSGNVVPLYLLPSLGGSHSLRGYDDYRFRDRNELLLNAEYRFRLLSPLDAAVFYDAGRVAARFGDLDLTRLRTSYGVGLRVHAKDRNLFRIDVGRSNEGTRVLLSISDALRPGHGSIWIPYVP